MNEWLIVPRDPLIFRDGKPFTATPGERANSLPFPFPSTLAGAVRTRSGTDSQGKFDASRIGELLNKSVRGPVLVELDADGSITQRYFPAPADALLVEADDKTRVQRHALAPIEMPQGALTDLPNLKLVGHDPHIKDKPYYKAPQFWKWDAMEAWLVRASDDGPFDPQSLGMEELPRDYRTHVSIESSIQTAREGALFQTSGMEFTRVELNDEKRMKDAHSLAIALETDAELNPGVDFLGGERRAVQWQSASKVFPEAVCPESIVSKIDKHKKCRLILATPAYFAKGYLPEYLESNFGARVVAAALPRYQTISGWDYAKPKGGEPKPTRRVVPAGSVYFLNLENVKDKDIEAFVKNVWLQPISDENEGKRFQRDGFGLAMLGAWESAEVKS